MNPAPLALTLVSVSFLAIATQTQATELVTNGGFDTGDFTGWDPSPGGGTVPGTFYGSYVASGGYTTSGSVNIYGDTVSTITQTLNTTIGVTYDISLWATGGDGGGGTYFGSGASGLIFAKIGGTDVISAADQQIDDTFTTWKEFSSSFTATSVSTTLVVGAKNSYWNYLIDDISVRTPTTPVPEPSAYGIAAGFTALGFVLFRRASRKA